MGLSVVLRKEQNT